jgi:hypothetical protein
MFGRKRPEEPKEDRGLPADAFEEEATVNYRLTELAKNRKRSPAESMAYANHIYDMYKAGYLPHHPEATDDEIAEATRDIAKRGINHRWWFKQHD